MPTANMESSDQNVDSWAWIRRAIPPYGGARWL